MANQSQSEAMWGPQASRSAPVSDRAGMIEHAAAHGRVVTRSPNSELYIEHTAPILAPAPLDSTARGQLAPRVVQADAMVARAEGQHAEAAAKFVESQRLMVSATAAEPWIEQQLLAASTALTVASSRLEAVKAHRDAIANQIAAWEAAGTLDAYDDACARQSGDGLVKALAPLVKRATKHGGDLGAVVADAQAVIAAILTARQSASGLAVTLGFARHRDSGITTTSAAIKIAAAFAAGFKAAAPKLDLKRWIDP